MIYVQSHTPVIVTCACPRLTCYQLLTAFVLTNYAHNLVITSIRHTITVVLLVTSINPKDNSDVLTRSDQPKNVTKENRVNFKGVPKCSPINISTLVLKISPIIDNMKKKQLDPFLNHVGFIQVNKVSEEELDPIKDTFTLKEAMPSPYKNKFIESMEKEIQNHTNHKHWTYCKKDEVPVYEMLRSKWNFSMKEIVLLVKLFNLRLVFVLTADLNS